MVAGDGDGGGQHQYQKHSTTLQKPKGDSFHFWRDSKDMGAHLSFWSPFSGTMDSKKVGWNRTIKRWSTFCTGAPSPYSTTVINWPNKECPLCYLKRHKPGHRRTIKDIVLNLLPLEMDFSRAKLPFRLSGVWKAWRIIFWTFTLTLFNSIVFVHFYQYTEHWDGGSSWLEIIRKSLTRFNHKLEQEEFVEMIVPFYLISLFLNLSNHQIEYQEKMIGK